MTYYLIGTKAKFRFLNYRLLQRKAQKKEPARVFTHKKT